jgi:glycosyltransferase involved in cell wall biosynthesis
MRSGFLAEELAARGHQVTWWASAFDHMSKTMLFPDDAEVRITGNLVVRALRGRAYSRNVSWRRYRDHAIIAAKFRRLAPLEPRPDLIVASTPDHQLAYEAVRFARQQRVPVVVDVRDQWPDLFLDVVPRPFRPALRIALARDFRMVRSTLRDADAIVSMMSQLLEWSLERAGRPANWRDRVFYLGAKAASPAMTDSVSKELAALLRQLAGRFVLVFVGTFGRYYAPTIIARAARRLQASGAADVRFVIAGDGPYRDEVRAAADGLDNVVLTGWLNEAEIGALLGIASAGIIPCSEDIDTFPNKAFAYLSAGLPLIASVSGDLRRLLGDTGVGLHYPPNDVEALAGCIVRLAENDQLRRHLAGCAKTLFDTTLNSAAVYSSFADHLERIAAECGVRTTTPVGSERQALAG